VENKAKKTTDGSARSVAIGLYSENSAKRLTQWLYDSNHDEHYSDENESDKGIDAPKERLDAEGDDSESLNRGTKGTRAHQSTAIDVEVAPSKIVTEYGDG
jgi:hypothetical protein